MGRAAMMRYEWLLSLSEGGMGQVELTVRKGGSFERLYALKRLRPAMRDDAIAREMFLEEARLAGLISHPNVAGVLDVGEDDDGPFLAMEYVEGITVRDLTERAHATQIPIPVEVALEIAAQAARGLATAHELVAHDGTPLHLVHRDISPHNILIGFDGIVRVADFGIARAIGRDHRTSTGVLKGKLGYMAPEVLRFQPADARSDLFSFGVVLYEMLASRRLYGGNDDMVRARRIMHEAPPDIGDIRIDVPPQVQALLVALLAKDPTERPLCARDVVATLERALRDASFDGDAVALDRFVAEGFEAERTARSAEVQASLAALPARVLRASRGRRGKWALGIVASLVLLLVLVLVVVLSTRAFGGDDDALGTEGEADIADVAHANGPRRVTLELRTSPSGAMVTGPGFEPLRTPATVTVPAGDDAVTLQFALQGHRVRHERLVPDENQRLELVLTALTPSEMGETSETSEPTSAVMHPTRHVRRARGMRRQDTPMTMESPGLDTLWD